MNYENIEKAKIIKEALKIVDKLSKSDLLDCDVDTNENSININDFDYDELQDLIIKSKKLTKNRVWKLY